MTQDKKPALLFVIDTPPTIKWPVVVTLPVDGGQTAEYQFTGVFTRMPDDELDALMNLDKPQPKPLPEIGPDTGELIVGEALVPAVPDKTMREILLANAEKFPKLLVGWEGVKRASGADAEFSVAALREQILGVNGKFLSAGLWRAVHEIRNGAPRLGN